MIHKQWFGAILLLSIHVFYLFNMKPSESNVFAQFQKFKHEFNKKYNSKNEQVYRFSIFNMNLIKIKNHNMNQSHSYKLGITPFVDLSQEQFAQIYLNYQIKTKQTHQFERLQEKLNSANFNINSLSLNQQIDSHDQHNLNRKSQQYGQQYTDIDWENQGHVSIVKNQGVCGSSWAFSSTSSIQSLYSIFKNEQLLLSEQQLIDCSSQYGNNGCEGGKMEYAFNYIKMHGVSKQSEYPYAGRLQQCRKREGDYKILGYQTIFDCNNLFNALHQKPVSVSVDASNWPLYKQGILSLCGNYANHGSLVVGVTQSYWKLKNSWGINWGQDGYIRIAKGNTCGVCSNPIYPIL